MLFFSFKKKKSIKYKKTWTILIKKKQWINKLNYSKVNLTIKLNQNILMKQNLKYKNFEMIN